MTVEPKSPTRTEYLDAGASTPRRSSHTSDFGDADSAKFILPIQGARVITRPLRAKVTESRVSGEANTSSGSQTLNWIHTA
jgi:hypothetical protein